MKTEQGTVSTTHIVGTEKLDRITVYWHDYSDLQGMVTIVCFGSSWTAYFGSMPADDIQGFFAMANTDYLVAKLLDCKWQKEQPRHKKYLARVVTAIKAHMTEEHDEN